MTGETHLLPAWRNAAAVLFTGQFQPGDVIPHDVLREALMLPAPSGKLTRDEWESWRLALLAQVDALAVWLLEEKNLCLKNVQGQGYMILPPAEQTTFAVKQGRKKIRAELRKMGRRLSFIDHASLSQDERKANADALARLSFMEQQFRKTKRRRLFEPERKQIEG